MSAFCYINGDIVPASEAKIGINDLGLQRGYAVFDFIRTYNGKLFHFQQHLERFHRSAEGMLLQVPLSDNKILEIAETLIKRSNLERPAVRLILTGGYADPSMHAESPNFIMSAEELPVYDHAIYSEGAKLVLAEFQREMPGVKSTNYVHSILQEPLRIKHGATDILYHLDGQISECPRSSFFVFRTDKLITPKDLTLAGITRKLVLDLAQGAFEIEERAITLDELRQIDEAFITSTTKGILPIVRIDSIVIGDGAVGEQTKTIMAKFAQYTSEY